MEAKCARVCVMGKGYRSGADRLDDYIYSFRLSFIFSFLYRISRRQQAVSRRRIHQDDERIAKRRHIPFITDPSKRVLQHYYRGLSDVTPSQIDEIRISRGSITSCHQNA